MKKDIVSLAKEIATKAHKGQFRKDGKTPYITHPEAVSRAVVGHHRKAVAWLHDVFEDTKFTRKDLLDKGIPTLVVDDVSVLTRRKWESYYDYLDKIKYSASVSAMAVKIADLEHNLSTLEGFSKKETGRLRDKFKLALYFLNY